MRLRIFFVLVLVFVLPLLAVSARADSFTNLAADNFAVLGATTVTNVPTSVISGNVGTWKSGGANAITGFNSSPGIGFPDSQVTGGLVYAGGPVPMNAQGDAHSVYTTLQALPGTDLTGQDLGGLILNPGVYKFTSSAQLTGVLTLNFGGASNQVIVIDTGSTLTTASGSSVVLQGWNPTDSVYWAVGSSATLGSTTSFQGNLISLTDDSLVTKAKDGCGSIIALNGQVSLQMNTIATGCNAATATIVGGTPPGTVPEPGTFALLSSGLALGFLKRRKLR